MKEILIINPPIRLDDKPRNIPHGLGIIANKIRQELGITPNFLDMNAYRLTNEELALLLEHMKFDIVMIGGIASAYRKIIEITDIAKRINPEVVVIVGGYVAMPEEVHHALFDHSKVDILCLGEGEKTVVEIVKVLSGKWISNLSKVAGICYRGGWKIRYTRPRPLIHSLDTESVLPAYDLLPMNIYLRNPVCGWGKDTDFISSRGCAYKCSFCYQPWEGKFRSHSAEYITNALVYLKTRYDIDFVSFQDDEFMTDLNRVKEFCDRKSKVLPDLLWSCTGRVNIIAKRPEIVQTMKDAGCVLISYGFESGSQKMLDSMHKQIKIKDMEKVVKISRKNGLPIPASFIIGMPGETEETCEETLEWCLNNNLPLDSLMFATPYPGTEIFDFAMETGRIDRKNLHDFLLKLGDARDFLINLTDNFTDTELVMKREEMMYTARENYNNYISKDEIMEKTKELYGDILSKNKIDDKEIEHKMKHGGILTF